MHPSSLATRSGPVSYKVTYGDANFAPGATASSALSISYASSDTTVATIVSGAPMPEPKSIVSQLGEAFPRVRIGLGEHPTGEELANWVLSIPSQADMKILEGAIATMPEFVRTYVMEKMKPE